MFRSGYEPGSPARAVWDLPTLSQHPSQAKLPAFLLTDRVHLRYAWARKERLKIHGGIHLMAGKREVIIQNFEPFVFRVIAIEKSSALAGW